MGEKMTLEQVRDELREWGKVDHFTLCVNCGYWADAIDAALQSRAQDRNGARIVDIYEAYKTWPQDIRAKLSLHDLRRMNGWAPQPDVGETMPTREEIGILESGQSFTDQGEHYEAMGTMLHRIADALDYSVVVPREPVGYGLCRKGDPRIVGFLPPSVADRPATSEEFLQNYEHVALYAAAQRGQDNE